MNERNSIDYFFIAVWSAILLIGVSFWYGVMSLVVRMWF